MTETYHEDHVLEVFLEETADRLDAVEAGLLRLESDPSELSTLINSIFRDAHSVKAGANLLKFSNIETLAHKLENVLEMLRRHELQVNEGIITASLESVDKLRELVENIDRSESISIRLHTAMLEMAVKKAQGA